MYVKGKKHSAHIKHDNLHIFLLSAYKVKNFLHYYDKFVSKVLSLKILFVTLQSFSPYWALKALIKIIEKSTRHTITRQSATKKSRRDRAGQARVPL